MTGSIVFYVDPGNSLHIIDSDDLPHYDTNPPLISHAVALINAGFNGVMVDQVRLADGRFFQALNVDTASPEGQMMQALQERHKAGFKLPLPKIVVQAVEIEHARRAKEASDD